MLLKFFGLQQFFLPYCQSTNIWYPCFFLFRTSEGAEFSAQLRVWKNRAKEDFNRWKQKKIFRLKKGAEYSIQVCSPRGRMMREISRSKGGVESVGFQDVQPTALLGWTKKKEMEDSFSICLYFLHYNRMLRSIHKEELPHVFNLVGGEHSGQVLLVGKAEQRCPEQPLLLQQLV